MLYTSGSLKSMVLLVIQVGTHSDLTMDVQEIIRLSKLGQGSLTAQKAMSYAKKAGIVSYIEILALTEFLYLTCRSKHKSLGYRLTKNTKIRLFIY